MAEPRRLDDEGRPVDDLGERVVGVLEARRRRARPAPRTRPTAAIQPADVAARSPAARTRSARATCVSQSHSSGDRGEEQIPPPLQEVDRRGRGSRSAPRPARPRRSDAIAIARDRGGLEGLPLDPRQGGREHRQIACATRHALQDPPARPRSTSNPAIRGLDRENDEVTRPSRPNDEPAQDGHRGDRAEDRGDEPSEADAEVYCGPGPRRRGLRRSTPPPSPSPSWARSSRRSSLARRSATASCRRGSRSGCGRREQPGGQDGLARSRVRAVEILWKREPVPKRSRSAAYGWAGRGTAPRHGRCRSSDPRSAPAPARRSRSPFAARVLPSCYANVDADEHGEQRQTARIATTGRTNRNRSRPRPTAG